MEHGDREQQRVDRRTALAQAEVDLDLSMKRINEKLKLQGENAKRQYDVQARVASAQGYADEQTQRWQLSFQAIGLSAGAVQVFGVVLFPLLSEALEVGVVPPTASPTSTKPP